MKQALLGLFTAAFMASAPALANEGEKDRRLGEKVDRICFASGISGFQAPDDIEGAVILRRGVNDRYLVKVIGPGSRSLKFAQAVAIDSRPSGGCVSRGDKLIFSDSPFATDPINRTSYTITAIYQWLEIDEASDEDEG